MTSASIQRTFECFILRCNRWYYNFRKLSNATLKRIFVHRHDVTPPAGPMGGSDYLAAENSTHFLTKADTQVTEKSPWLKRCS